MMEDGKTLVEILYRRIADQRVVIWRNEYQLLLKRAKTGYVADINRSRRTYNGMVLKKMRCVMTY